MRLFCKESSHIRVIRTGESICQEYDGQSPHKDAVASLFESEPESSAVFYFVLRGVERFYSEYNALPGAIDDHVEPDIGKLKNCVSKILTEYQVENRNVLSMLSFN